MTQKNIKHGLARRGLSRPPTYVSWAQMRSRCNNPKVPEFVRYGGRGIKVCDRWASYEAFLADMGARPDGTSIDRIDVNGDYTPENCRWATKATQVRNTRRTRFVEIGGVSKPLCDWVAERGLNKSTVGVRLSRGWSVEKALEL